MVNMAKEGHFFIEVLVFDCTTRLVKELPDTPAHYTTLLSARQPRAIGSGTLGGGEGGVY